MLARFYEKYPDYADKTFLSVKVICHIHVRARYRAYSDAQGGHSGYAGSGAELYVCVHSSFLMISGSHRAFRAHVYRKEKVRASVERCVAALRGTKKIDLFQPARLERGVSIEELVGAFVELLKEGKFEHLGLSECKAESLRRAHAVRSLPPVLVHKCLFFAQVYPISIAEIEISPMSYEEETKKGAQRMRFPHSPRDYMLMAHCSYRHCQGT